jgi:hypothetical protein
MAAGRFPMASSPQQQTKTTTTTRGIRRETQLPALKIEIEVLAVQSVAGADG